MKRKKPRFPIQFEDVAKAARALQDALGNNYVGAWDPDISWSGDPRRAAIYFVSKVQTLRRALESARKVVDTIGETRAKGAALPDMARNDELKQRLNVLVSAEWGAPGEPLPAAKLGSVKASIAREARKLRYERGEAEIDRQKWRIDRLERIADNWARAARLDASHGGETEEAVPLAPVFQVGGEAWAEAAATARRDEGESDTDIAARRARAEAEQEARAKALRETFERAEREREAEAARAQAEAAREANTIEETIRRHNAPLRPIRNGAKRTYLINVSSAKGERDATGYLKRETFAIEGRVWWPLGVNRAAEDDGKGGHRATSKRNWIITFLPVGMQAGAASSIKEAEDMARTLAPRFREVENVGEIRSGDSAALSPLARISGEYNERKRVDAETEKRLAEQRSRAEAEAIKKEIEEEEAEFEARAAKKEKEEAARAERTERQRKQAEREREEQALDEQSGRDYAARTEAEHREPREHERKQREREREREREWADRERLENRELARRERRDKAVDKASMTRSWAAVDNAKDLASWLEALERIDRQARADGGPGASASVLIDGLPLGLDALVFALSGENEEAVQATFDEVAIQNPQFARVLRRAMVAQKGKVSAAMLASSLRRRATLAKQVSFALGPPEPVKQRVERLGPPEPVKRAKARNIARNVAELATRMLAMRKEPQRGPQQEAKRNDVTTPEPSVKVRASKRGAAPKEKTVMAKKKKSETAELGVKVREGNLYRVIVGREHVDAEVVGRDGEGWILRRLPFEGWPNGRQLRGRRSTEELKQCSCVFQRENEG